jgi:hypothetical protein
MATAIDFECPRCSAACSHSMRGALVRCPRCVSFVQVPGARNAQSSQDTEQEHEPQIKVTDVSDLGVSDLGPPTIIFSCKHCRSRIETEAANAGLPCICPGCHVDLIIPGTARPILLPQPSTAPVPRPPLLDRVMLAILLGTVGLGAILLLSTLAGK